jgi:hypothetical protein
VEEFETSIGQIAQGDMIRRFGYPSGSKSFPPESKCGTTNSWQEILAV